MNSEKNLNKKQKKQWFPNFCYDFVRITGAIPILLWLRPKVYRPYNTPTPKGKMLLSANHRSYMDPVSVHLAFPFRRMNCLATSNLFNTKLKRAFFNRMLCIEVDKENFALSAFRDVVSRLQEGKIVVIFPEGSVERFKETPVRSFKSGAVLMAHRADTPILPIYIAKHRKWYHRLRIVVGEPFDIRAQVGAMPTLEQLDAVSEMLQTKEWELHEYFKSLPIYKKLNKNIEEETLSSNKDGEPIEQYI